MLHSIKNLLIEINKIVMKNSKIVMVFILSILSWYNVSSQIQEKKEYNLEYTERAVVKPDPIMKSILDSVYPEVTYLVQSFPQSRFAYLFFIKDGDTILTNWGSESRFQFEGAFLIDSVFRYSYSTLIKAFIFIDLVRRQGSQYITHGVNIQDKEMHLIPCLVDLSNNYNSKYRLLDSSSRFINMKAEVQLDPSMKYLCNGGFNYAIKAYYEFQIIEGAITGAAFSYIDKNGTLYEEMYTTTTGEQLNYAKDYYKRLREQEKGNY
jgi:hypothetical protein